MEGLAAAYSDVVIMDTTFKTNRFNMPLVVLIGIDCEGRNVLLGLGLI